MLPDPFAGTDAMPGPLTLPTMLAEAGVAFFDPPARVALSALRDELLFAIGIGLAPATCLSVIALALGYRAGYATRHEADLARIERVGDSPRGAS